MSIIRELHGRPVQEGETVGRIKRVNGNASIMVSHETRQANSPCRRLQLLEECNIVNISNQNIIFIKAVRDMLKRKLWFVLAVVFVLCAFMPATALAENNQSKFKAITMATAARYDTPLPTKGKKITQKKLTALLAKLPQKTPGKGDVLFRQSLQLTRNVASGEYTVVLKDSSWSKFNAKDEVVSAYSEMEHVKGWNADDDGATFCILTNTDKKYQYVYSWRKGILSGSINKTRKTKAIPAKMTKGKNLKLYPDQKVLGQKCLVNSFQVNGDTVYFYTSRKTGQAVKVVRANAEQVTTVIYFTRQNVSKPASFFKPPKKVSFNKKAAAPQQAQLLQEQFSLMKEALAM